ncbi:MAG: SDR family oxidoreductase [Bacteroidota bacterium]
MSSLASKTAIVTGGAGVLGGAMAKGLAQAGAKVGILGRNLAKIESKVQEIERMGGKALGLQADVLNREDLEQAKTKILDHWESLDILVNAAGGNMKGATIMPDQDIFDLSLDDFSRVNDLNLKGTLLPSLIFGKSMAEKKAGCIVNISSMAAQQALTRVVGYSASKAAIDNFTKWMAVEMAHKFGPKLRVNAIAPGFFIGEQNRSLLLNEDGSLTKRGKSIIDQTPMRRFGEPEELISTLLWLCDDNSSFISGIIVAVDGGFSAFSGV